MIHREKKLFFGPKLQNNLSVSRNIDAAGGEDSENG